MAVSGSPTGASLPPTPLTPLQKPVVPGTSLAGDALVDDVGARLEASARGRLGVLADVRAYIEAAIEQVEFIDEAEVPRTLRDMRAAGRGELGDIQLMRDLHQKIAMDIRHAHALTSPPVRPQGMANNGYMDALRGATDGKMGLLRSDMLTRKYTAEQFAAMSADEIARIYGDDVQGSAGEIMRMIENGDILDIRADAYPELAEEVRQLTDDVEKLSGWLGFDYDDPAIVGDEKGLPNYLHENGNKWPEPKRFVREASCLLPRIDELQRKLLNVEMGEPASSTVGLPDHVPPIERNPFARKVALGGTAGVAVVAAVTGALALEAINNGGGGDADGVVVSDHPFLRGAASTLGFGLAGAGAAGLALTRAKPLRTAGFPAQVTKGLVASLAIGGALAGVGAMIRADERPYLSRHGDRTSALVAAAKQGGDVGVHRTSEGKFGLMELEDQDVDVRGAGKASLGNKDVQLDAIVSHDGDWHERVAAGEYRNHGVVGGARSLDGGAGPGEVIGARIGTDDAHRPRSVGERVGDGAGYVDAQGAARAAFELGAGDHAILEIDGRWHAFDVAGGRVDEGVRARGTSIGPWDHVLVQHGATTAAASAPGSGFESTALVGDDISGFDPSRPEDLKRVIGRRIAVGSDGSVVRVGARTGDPNGYSTRMAATTAMANAPGDHVVLQLAKGVFHTFELDGLGTDAHIAFPSTLLGVGPEDAVLQVGNKVYVAGGGERATMQFLGRATPFETREPIGQAVGTRAGDLRGGVVRGLVASFPTLDAALGELRGRRADDLWSGRGHALAIVRGSTPQGEFHLYEVGDGGAARWDDELGHVEAYAEHVTGRRTGSRTTMGVGSETVYNQTFTLNDVVLEREGSRRALRGAGGWQLREEVNWGATTSLRAQKQRERDEAEARRRREAAAAEARRQQAQEDAARRARENATRSSNPGGGGGGGGSPAGGSPGGSTGGNGYGW